MEKYSQNLTPDAQTMRMSLVAGCSNSQLFQGLFLGMEEANCIHSASFSFLLFASFAVVVIRGFEWGGLG